MARPTPAPRPGPADRHRTGSFALARPWLYLGMGLGGILTVALIVSADQSYAGVDGMRSVRAILAGPAAAVVVPGAVPSAAPVPASPTSTATPAPALATPTAPVAALVPAAQPAPASPTPAATPAASAAPIAGPSLPLPTPAPTVPPGPTAAPPATPAPTAPPPPSPTPSASPTPGLAITTDHGATALLDVSGLVPGDSISRTLALRNSGTLDLRYTIAATQTASTLLWTDPADGLQLTVATLGGTVLYSGPIAGLGTVAGPSVLAAGASETLRYTVAFPASAPNAFQGLVQDLTFVYTATQYP